mgnify:CR=1 FL=1
MRRERAIRARVVSGVTRIFVQEVSRYGSVARVTHDSRGLIPWGLVGTQREEAGGHSYPVSYTHLTLPTNREV